MKRLLHVLLLVLVAVPAAGQRVDFTTAGKVIRLSDPQIAPAGDVVAVLVSRTNYAENRSDAELVLVDTATREQRVLVTGKRGLSSPRWSPDGSKLAFLAQAEAARAQVFVVPAIPGATATQITKAPMPVINFAWRPDGQAIAYSAADEEPKKEGEARFVRAFEIQHNSYLQAEAPRPVHLWLASIDGSPARRLTSGTWTLPAPFPPGPAPPAPSWSADGRSLAFVKVATAYSGDRSQSTIQILDADSGKTRALTTRVRGEGQPVFSPDGRSIAYWFARNGETRYGNDIVVSPATGGEGRPVTTALDRHILRGVWLPSGRELLVAANDRTTTGVWVQPLEGAARRLDLGNLVANASYGLDASISRDGRIALLASEPQRPVELFLLTSTTAKPQRLTDFNAAIAKMTLGKTETIDWDGPDGLRMNGVVTYPPDFDTSKRYPLVLYIHGGPRATSKEAFSTRTQLFAAQGWIVFEPNYRGSDNMGDKFLAAIWNDAGAGPGRDVMSGVEILKARGIVDETRMAVSGWSYGGFMTTWLLGNYPDVWRVAVAGAAVTDNMAQYNLGDANVARGAALGGSPYTDPKRMQAAIEQSPLTYAWKVKAPTLILALVGDYRVPIANSYAFYHALRDNNVPVQFIGYPLPGHNASDPAHQRDIERRWVEWIKKHFDEPRTKTE